MVSKKITKSFLLTTLIIFLNHTINAQLWQKIEPEQLGKGEPTTKAENYSTYLLNEQLFDQVLTSIKKNQYAEVSFPDADDKWIKFKVWESSVLSPKLAAKYPEIKTFTGKAINDPSCSVKFEKTPLGIYVMIFKPDGTSFVNSYSENDIYTLNSFSKSSYLKRAAKDQAEGKRKVHVCELNGGSKHTNSSNNSNRQSLPKLNGITSFLESGSNLRTYSLAITCTGEYASFHGGTVANALSAMAVTMNRVNGVYEREVACTMQLIGDNDELIFLNSNSDPYTNNSANAYLSEIADEIDKIVPNNSYDIGHGFSTGAGGLANLGVVCNSGSKYGVTGTNSPVGDPYDIDFVAHELGHQFGGHHTFNGSSSSCELNISLGHNYEPGSGSTIQAYAGICSPQNIQNNSNDYFHTHSFEEMVTHTTVGSGASCAAVSVTNNNVPSVSALETNLALPISTPFKLTAEGADLDGNNLTYCWEQYDIGPQGHPNKPSGDAVIFRSYSPTASPTRFFPRLQDIVNNTQTLGELLPDYSRNLNFRVTVRDDHPIAGGVTFDEAYFSVTEQAGPFLVTSPNTNIAVNINDDYEVTWDVANTNQAPVSCSKVNILLSTDGGFTYPYTLLTETENDGVANVIIPPYPTANARIMVEAVGNVFFDISNQNFTITSSGVDFAIDLDDNDLTICANTQIETSFEVLPIGGFNNDVNLSVDGLPQGVNANLNTTVASVGEEVELTISADLSALAGNYIVEVVAESGGTTHRYPLLLRLYGALATHELLSPLNGETGVLVRPTLSWERVNGGGTYKVFIATDEAFNNLVYESTEIGDTTHTLILSLEIETEHFWKVEASNPCAPTVTTETRSFTTMGVTCRSFNSDDVNWIIPDFDLSGLVSDLEVSIGDAELVAVNVINLSGEHPFVSDLSFTLIAPDDTEVLLAAGLCEASVDYNLGFSDEGVSQSNVTCPITSGTVYTPVVSLSGLSGKNPNGMWHLKIVDQFELDEGNLRSWGLEICYIDETTSVHTSSEFRNNISLYPNPAKGVVSIASGNINGEIEKVQIIDALGVLIIDASGIELGKEINIKGLSSGVYFAKVYIEGAIYTQSLLVE